MVPCVGGANSERTASHTDPNNTLKRQKRRRIATTMADTCRHSGWGYYSLLMLIWSIQCQGSIAFSIKSKYNVREDVQSRNTALRALSPRQLQFWEDVEDGLVDVEKFYQSGSMERVYTFCARARGDLPPPEPSSPGHQPSEEHIDGLEAKEFWDVSSDATRFPWAAELEAKAHIIIEEFEQQLFPREEEKSDSSTLYSGDSAWQSKVMGTGWSAFRLQRLGVWNAQNCAQFPKTYRLLKELNIPLAVRGVCFARQRPGSGVAPHTDGRNFILTSHLGLKIPEGCWIKVGKEQRSWMEGKLITLDTSFEHSTGNPSNTDRHVLIIDFWHPDLTEAERAGLEFIYDLRNQFESGKVPFRPPKVKRTPPQEEEEKEGQGLGGLWKSLVRGK